MNRLGYPFVALLLACLMSLGNAWAAPDQVALTQAREDLMASFRKQVEQASRDIDSGRLEGQPLAQAYRTRGVGRSHLAQYPSAVADFTQAIEIDGFNPQFYQDRAIAFVRMRDFLRANTDLDMVLGLDRDNFNGLREKGRVAFYQGDFDGAARYFLLASKVTAGEGQVYAALWTNLAALRGGRQAPLRFEAAGRKQWPLPVADLLLGQASPEQMLELADSPNPGTYLSYQCEALFYLGQHYLVQGRRDEARASFQAAVDTGKVDYMEYDWALREIELMR